MLLFLSLTLMLIAATSQENRAATPAAATPKGNQHQQLQQKLRHLKRPLDKSMYYSAKRTVPNFADPLHNR